MNRYLNLNTGSAAEEWREIPGHPSYFVSSYGRVKSRKYEEPIILKPCFDRGCEAIRMCEGGVIRKYGVARIVAETFLRVPAEPWRVYHRDGDQKNNHVANLVIRTIKRKDR